MKPEAGFWKMKSVNLWQARLRETKINIRDERGDITADPMNIYKGNKGISQLYAYKFDNLHDKVL